MAELGEFPRPSEGCAPKRLSDVVLAYAGQAELVAELARLAVPACSS